MLEATEIGVELVTRDEPGPDSAGDRLQLVVANQCANVVLGAAELGRDLADREGCGPLHAQEYRWWEHRPPLATQATERLPLGSPG